MNVKTVKNQRYDTLYSRFMATGGSPITWPKTRHILEYEGMEKIHISKHEVFENINTVRRQRCVNLLST